MSRIEAAANDTQFAVALEEIGHRATLGRRPRAISERISHTEIGVTMNVYGHLFEGKQRELDSRPQRHPPPDPLEEAASRWRRGDLDDDTSPERILVLGSDPAGNMLELVVLHFEDGRDMVIHAMRMRRQYETQLPPQEPMT